MGLWRGFYRDHDDTAELQMMAGPNPQRDKAWRLLGGNDDLILPRRSAI